MKYEYEALIPEPGAKLPDTIQGITMEQVLFAIADPNNKACYFLLRTGAIIDEYGNQMPKGHALYHWMKDDVLGLKEKPVEGFINRLGNLLKIKRAFIRLRLRR
jgi:hypothetical protein